MKCETEPNSLRLNTFLVDELLSAVNLFNEDENVWISQNSFSRLIFSIIFVFYSSAFAFRFSHFLSIFFSVETTKHIVVLFS